MLIIVATKTKKKPLGTSAGGNADLMVQPGLGVLRDKDIGILDQPEMFFERKKKKKKKRRGRNTDESAERRDIS